MNICIFCGNLANSGGTEKCSAFLANALCDRYNIYVIDVSNKDNVTFFEYDNRVSVNHLKEGSILSKINQLRKYIKKNNIDVVINVEAMLGIYSLPITLFKKTKNIVWEHGNFYQKQCKSIDRVRALEMIFCNRYITLTKKDKKNFEENFKGKCRVEYIYNPIILPKENPIYDIASKTILSVGVVREIKGFKRLIDVAEIVLNKHKDFIWEIYGRFCPTDEYYKFLISKIKEKNLEGRVVFKGETKKIDDVYKKASMLVMTSLMEGLPMTLLEGRAYKLPLVSFDIETGPSEIIEDNVNGYLIEDNNTKEMAEKITELIENQELRQKFSDNSLNNIEKFSVEGVIDKWCKLIESL